MKRIVLFWSIFCLWLSAIPASAYFLDAPHHEANLIGCATCHNVTHTPDPIDPDDTWANFLCKSCHDGISAPTMANHTDQVVNSKPTGQGLWTNQCIDCHDPHFQGQLDWIRTDTTSLWLVQGFIPFQTNYLYEPGVGGIFGQTTITFSAGAKANNPLFSDPATWHAKGGYSDPTFAVDGSRGLLFVPGLADTSEVYEIVAATGSLAVGGTITLKGQVPTAQVGPFSQFGIIYGQALKSSTSPAYGTKDIKFFSPLTASGETGFGDTSASTTPTGICQVCHNNTGNWKADGTGNTHEPASNCTTCHGHTEGFPAPEPTCTPDILNLEPQTIFSGQKINITATNMLTVGPDYIIESGSTVSLAAQKVTLLPGFSAQEGSMVKITSEYNHEPIAFEDNIQVEEGGTVSGNVLANDNDVDCDSFTAHLDPDPELYVKHGTLELNPDGTFTYVHDGTETTHDQFTYYAMDADASTPVIAYITISPVNDAPQAHDDLFTVDINSTQVLDVLGNDIDVDYKDILTIAVAGAANHGTTTIVNDTAIRYTPATGYIGQDSFSYTMRDAEGVTADATVTVNVVNNPVCEHDQVLQDTTVDTDTNITYRNPVVLGPAYLIPKNINFKLTSSAITLAPGFKTEQGSTVHLIAEPWEDFNAPPVAEDDSFSVNEGQVLTANPLLNDRDTECDQLKAVLMSLPGNGTLLGLDLTDNNEFTSFTYQHDGSETTHDSFTYYAKDAESSNVVTVSISVNPMNDTPVANNDRYFIYSYDTIQLDVLANDYDLDPGDTLTIDAVGAPNQGGEALINGNLIAYTPSPNFVGTETFTYTVIDSHGQFAIVTVYINNTPPEAIDQTVVTNEFQPILISLTGKDFDHDPLSYEIIKSPVYGTLVGTPPYVTYTSQVTAGGEDGFTFRVNDSMYNSPPATVAITVNPVEKIWKTNYQYDERGRIKGKTVTITPLN